MSLMFIYRLCTFAFVMIAALIVMALSAQTTAALQKLAHTSALYSNFGVASGVLTLVSIPFMLMKDCFGAGPSSVILFELIWLSVLWILFFVTGGLTFADANFSKIVKSCDELSISPDLVNICRDAQPIGILAILAAVALLIYFLALLVFAAMRSSRQGPVWMQSVKDSEKAY
ncbi:hypothetical protein L226DRAFT_569386 [Lentinus tigrinus ALCF2SS1-7]|uniref:MARVEL domain-containing protein n=1 Tax=Lentinus tigrinus ALCF2SS1-6 TaxID=1328759 RepID=A0A5C2SJF3_9APHY|nr:hypothetical protein L227DRAFT_386008 [Lentinus tigrinus ALCF2SS1-6]RPD77188.1 hypothetical protein L226DRAFT_569386 [Lentinus tigrinus ALCF2SS1-7]